MSIQILVVAGETIEAEKVAADLRQMGYEITGIAKPGEAAIEQAGAADLVLMDVSLQSEMDGIDTDEQIQKQRSIPVVYLTASADNLIPRQAKSSSLFGCLIKPFKQADLKVAIEVAWTRFQTEQALRASLQVAELRQQEAQQLSQLRSQFISMMSHEFRTPLTVIKVATEVLQHYHLQLSPEKQQRHFQRISEAIDDINQLLEEVLMLGQAEMPLAFLPRSIEVVGFCQTLVDAFQVTVKRQVLFVNQLDKIEANLDEKLLRQLLNNLLSNAAKYSPEGKIITLRLFQQGESLSFEVQDQGVGIAPEDLKFVFEPFQRGGNVGKVAGTGLGLAIAKRAVELHGGEISVVSAIDRGTTFTVILPLQPPKNHELS